MAGDTGGYADIFRKDLVTGEIIRLSVAANGAGGGSGSFEGRISADGRFVSFSSGGQFDANDTNGVTYQWLRNGHPISGATHHTYTLTTADTGQKISARVEGHRAGIDSDYL